MTDNNSNSTQFKVWIDAPLADMIGIIKAHTYAENITSLRIGPTFQDLIRTAITKLYRQDGFEKIIVQPNGLFAVYAPPSSLTESSVRMGVRLSDQDIIDEIERLSELSGRPKSHILYSFIRHYAEIETVRIRELRAG
ncbi:MAG: hypothetical protein AAFP97_09530 [Pseudomonadota bacterium]